MSKSLPCAARRAVIASATNVVLALITCCGASPATAETIAGVYSVDAGAGTPAVAAEVFLSDLVKINLDAAATVAAPAASVLSGTAVRYIGVYKSGKTWSACFIAETAGTSQLSFHYVAKAGAPPTVVKLDVSVQAIRPGRLLELSNDGKVLQDLATGKPPQEGIRVGDLLRYVVAKHTDIENVSSATATGTLKKVSVVFESGVVYAYFYAETAGKASFTVRYKILGAASDGGYVLPPTHILP